MKISKIISDLIQDNITVERAILVLKVLLNENDNTEIKNWINNEINGYEINDTIPKYRHIPTNVIGTVHNPAKIVKKPRFSKRKGGTSLDQNPLFGLKDGSKELQ